MWGIGKRTRRPSRRGTQAQVRRVARAEPLETRALMTAAPAPVHVGIVYLETDYLNTAQDQGADTLPDRFLLTFTGGAADTELTEVRVSTDKDSDGLSIGDLIFDTAPGGRGKEGAHPFRVTQLSTADPRATVSGVVEDGSQLLVLNLRHFRAGDTVEFTLDVDEVLRMSPDLDVFNSRLDVIASGQEFQDSILSASFTAPHFESAGATNVFENDYGNPESQYGLDLPADASDDPDSRPNRSAAAIASVQQVPKPISIGGTVFLDNNLNERRDAGESGLAGVDLALWQWDEASQRYVSTSHTTQSDAQGRYEFGVELGLMPGTYRVVESQPDGLFSVTSLVGTVGDQPSGQSESPDVLTEIEIPLGDTHAVHYDFAEAAPASISGFVYRDDSDDGRRDSGEPGIGDVRVRLEAVDTIAAQSSLVVTTGADGSYRFDGLSPGRYRIVQLDQPSPYTDGLDTAGMVDGQRVGEAINPGDSIEGVMLIGTAAGTEYNFGELPLGSLSGRVFLPPAGEDCDSITMDQAIPVVGALIRLFASDGELVAETRTATDGTYHFANLAKGEYRIEELTPAGLIDGEAKVGRIDGLTVGTANGSGMLSRIVLPAGADGTEYNFCEAAPAEISGVVYHDQNDNGNRASTESGIPGAAVRLIDAAGTVVASTTTDASGHYQFVDLIPGRYVIEEVTPEGYLDGQDQAGRVDGQVSGQVAAGGDRISDIELRQGQAGLDYNFGELLPATLSGRVHADLDGDCIWDVGEDPLAGVVIRLLDSEGRPVSETTTDATGQYQFTGLRPGSYTVVQQQPEGYFNGGQRAGTTGGVVTVANQIGQIAVGSGQLSAHNDFCEHPPASIEGLVFADRDGDCLHDPNEPGLSGVRIELLDGSGQVLETTTTDADGRYAFTQLRRGRYTIREIQPVGFLQGSQHAGSGGGDDSSTDLIQNIEIGWGENLLEYDFCEIEPASIAGRVFADANGDCIHQPELGEQALAGVTVRLHDASGRVIATTQTNAAGSYQFRNLRPGSYQVSEVQPSGWFHGGQTIGTGGGRVLAADHIGEIALAANQQLVGYDFCEVEPGSLSGVVYVDLDRDCVYEPSAGEQPLADVEVQLHDASGALVATTRTNVSGRYQFENLRPGTYRVTEIQPTGLFQGGQRVGSGGGVVLADDVIGQINVGPGDELVDYDFCELAGSTLSGYVWADRDEDARFDSHESAIANVEVNLYDDAGQFAATTRTDSQGAYRFVDLAPGTYTLRQSQPADYFHGGQVAGSHGGDVSQADRISGIQIPGSSTLTEYNFPEIPPAIISGYVFQDGGTLQRDEPPSADQLRQFRDGRLTSDDVRLENVVLQLRDESGQRIAIGQALQGQYDGPTIQVTTDSDGFYQFTGLRPGVTFHVYQVQPGGFVDGLDTAGTSPGSLAANVADLESQPELQDLVDRLAASPETDPGSDAILRITTRPGAESAMNNFSEIIVEPTREGPLPITPAPELVSPPIVRFDEFAPRELLFLGGTTELIVNPMRWARSSTQSSWHLSVINGGQPRGSGLDLQQIIIPASSQQWIERWEEADANRGRWRMFDQRGTALEHDRSIVLGTVSGQPLVGDFNGDGRDEVAIFSEGEWIIDLSGNGAFDPSDLWVMLGSAADRPIAGDWDGDGKDDVGIFGPEWQRDTVAIRRDAGLPDPANPRRSLRKNLPPSPSDATNGERLLRKSARGRMRADLIDHVFRYGAASDSPLAGDWNGDGVDSIAVYRAGVWSLDADGDGRWSERDVTAAFGQAGDLPVVGDWNGDGIDELAVVRGDLWIIDSDGDRRLTAADTQIRIPRESNERPVMGDWDGDGKDSPGLYRFDESAPSARRPAA